MPDTDYKAVAPGVVARFAAAPKVGIVLAADVPLMLDAGPIARPPATARRTCSRSRSSPARQIMLAPHVALLLRGDFNREASRSRARPSSMAAARGVTAATDRSWA